MARFAGFMAEPLKAVWALLSFCPAYTSRIFFHGLPGNHNQMPAAHAFQPEIDAYPENFPFMAAAGMGLF